MLNIRSIDELTGLLGTTVAELDWTLQRVDSLSQVLSIKDLDRPDKKPREVYNPSGPLRTLQEALHYKILQQRLDRSPHSYGGVPGRDQVSCVERHLGQCFCYTGDIRNFYPGIHFERVRRLYLDLGCSDGVARALTRLTTNHHRLEQGYITSPIIADRIFRLADTRIGQLCKQHRLVYTRFVDDITISGPFDLRTSGIPTTISKILAGTGFQKHPRKEGYGSISSGATILGLRLNKGWPDVAAEYFNETVRRLQDMASLGADGPFTGPFFTEAELHGRMRYVCWVNPNRRARLFPLWNALNWEQIHRIAAARGIVIRQCRFVVDRVP